MILTPVLINLVDQCPDHKHVDYNIVDTKRGCVATLAKHKSGQIAASSHNLASTARVLQKIAKATLAS